MTAANHEGSEQCDQDPSQYEKSNAKIFPLLLGKSIRQFFEPASMQVVRSVGMRMGMGMMLRRCAALFLALHPLGSNRRPPLQVFYQNLLLQSQFD